MTWDRRTLQHREPCKDCPFKVRSAPGWIGGYSLDSYSTPPSVGMPTSCHHKDKGADDPRTAWCAGSLALIANDPDVVPLDEYAEAVAAVGERPDCIATVADFREHHASADDFHRRLTLRDLA